jgi:hypothetical protein
MSASIKFTSERCLSELLPRHFFTPRLERLGARRTERVGADVLGDPAGGVAIPRGLRRRSGSDRSAKQLVDVILVDLRASDRRP